MQIPPLVTSLNSANMPSGETMAKKAERIQKQEMFRVPNKVSSVAGPSSATGESKARLVKNFDGFLKLFLTQIKHQNPMDPMDGNEFMAQLAQFAQVEQSIQSNTQLEQLIDLQKQNLAFSNAGFLDKEVRVPSNTLDFKGTPSEVSYYAGENAEAVLVQLFDEKGQTIRSFVGPHESGLQRVVWDGVDQSQKPVAKGAYKILVTEKYKDNSTRPIGSYVRVRIDGVDTSQESPWLLAGSLRIDPKQVKEVYMPLSAAPQASGSTQTAGADLKRSGHPPSTALAEIERISRPWHQPSQPNESLVK